MNARRLAGSILLCGATLVAAVVMWPRSEETKSTRPRTYEEIVCSGIIRATTEYNSVGFHVDHDTIAGFHYELFQAFARDKGLQAEIIPEMELNTQLEGINHGTFDIIAGSLLITSEQKDSLLLFSHPILLNRQVLVQRKPQSEQDTAYIAQQLQLAQKTVYLPEGSPVKYRIHNLSAEIADTIYVKELPKYGSEQLMALVAHGDIDYAICEESIAKRLIGQYPQLDIDTAISFNQFYGWGVSKESQALLDTLNAWLDSYKDTSSFKKLLKKYDLQ